MGIVKNIINYFYIPRMKLNKHLNMGKILLNLNTTKPFKSIYDVEIEQKDGTKTTLRQYQGKKILIVNTASECGYTPQYTQLQEMHEKMNKSLQILAFPCNNFGGQEPGTDLEIEKFCIANYGVSFAVLKKTNVIGDSTAPIYKWLTDKNLNGWNSQPPEWNFCKYLIDENGNLIAFYSQHIEPLSQEILQRVTNA